MAAAGYIISVLKRRKFIFEVRDLWPDSIEAVGAMSNQFILGALRSIEEFLYRRADKIIAVAYSTREILTKRGIPKSKIEVVPNGADINLFTPGPKQNYIRKEYGISEGDFLVSYIGTHGMAHGLKTVLDTALLVKDKDNIKFIFVGEGAEKEKLIETAKSYDLKNVRFIGQQNKNVIPYFYQASDACLVPLINQPLFSAVIPSKIFEIMSCARPIILSVKGEACAMIERANAGITIEPENPNHLADAILRLYNDNNLSTTLGNNGRSFIEKYFSRERMALDYIGILTKYGR